MHPGKFRTRLFQVRFFFFFLLWKEKGCHLNRKLGKWVYTDTMWLKYGITIRAALGKCTVLYVCRQSKCREVIHRGNAVFRVKEAKWIIIMYNPVYVFFYQSNQRLNSSQSNQALSTPVVSINTPSLPHQSLVYSSMNSAYSNGTWALIRLQSYQLQVSSECVSLCHCLMCHPLSLSDYSLNTADLTGFGSPAGPSLGSMAAWQQHQLGPLGLVPNTHDSLSADITSVCWLGLFTSTDFTKQGDKYRFFLLICCLRGEFNEETG